jgi:hypothetical protein
MELTYEIVSEIVPKSSLAMIEAFGDDYQLVEESG